jgi:2,3-bisphosphoglycerate-dependent phosphoglycerate mutase
MQTELFLLRHGKTVWNAEERFQGHQDSPLTLEGIAQAEAAAAYLRTQTLTALYSSDLPRTLQTSHPIALATGLTILHEPALRERNLGIFEGLTHPEIEARHAEVYARYVAREPEYVIPNGESLHQLHQRGLEVMERLARRHPGERIAIVSHGALITTFMRHLHGIPLHHPRQFSIHNGSISHVRFDSATSGWSVVALGEVQHLEGITVAD